MPLAMDLQQLLRLETFLAEEARMFSLIIY